MNIPGNRSTLLPQILPSHEPKGETKNSGKGSVIKKNSLASAGRVAFEKAPGKLSKKNSDFQTSASSHEIYYRIDQAGAGLFAIKDAPSLPTCTLKEYQKLKSPNVRKLVPIQHKNLVSLLGFFETDRHGYLAYEYEHIPITLGCVAGFTRFNEPDIATICREVLEGLKFIHAELKISHGSIKCSNILLTYSGDLKIANIGDSILQGTTLRDRDKDLRAVGAIAIGLSDLPTLVREELPEAIPATSELSTSARSFIENTKRRRVDELLEDDFLKIASPGGAWSLKPHYFEALPFSFRVGVRLPENPCT
ncbi:kinase-like domain-containing protein [Aspergillus insuetus]